ncbi:hypothetical protein QP164_14575 [Sphingomonas sp. LR59]|uniref:hypothetical protein n=1 Tax=Sphingomonas sp. LR59 TaxID=3050232 RepID=UPI002FE197D7
MNDDLRDDDDGSAGPGTGSSESGDDAGHTVLIPFLGDPPPPAEVAMWAAMSMERRAKAMQRLKTLARWQDGEGDIPPAQAAADAGVSLNRFFEMAKAWREARSLSSLGTFAKSSRRTDPREVALQRIVARVIGKWPTGSVRQMAMDLGQAFEEAGGGKVGTSMLRRVVEDELRRREVEGQLGNEIQFDCGACSLLRPDDSPYTLFAVLDRGSQLLLGAALGDVSDSRAGYAAAAGDALRRIDAGLFDGLPWVEAVARMALVAGLDADHWVALQARMASAGVKAPVQPSTSPKRFGRYLKPAVGDRLGRLDMWYGRTVPDDARAPKVADRSLRLDPADADAFLAVQLDEHDADRRALLPRHPTRPCPTIFSSR